MSLRSDCEMICAAIDARPTQAMDDELRALLILAEDHRYYRHRGVDLLAVARAVFTFLTKTGFSGASTLEMQLVRTLTNRREISFRRKFQEAFIARCVSLRRSKEDIATAYMDLAYFGEEVIGVEAAAHRLFGRSVSSCSIAQKAVIVSALKRPIPTQITNQWFRRIFKRSRGILERFQADAPPSPHRPRRPRL